MKTKWLETDSIFEMEEQCNKFEATHNVKATQTHVTVYDGKRKYTTILYYEGGSSPVIPTPQPKPTKMVF